jgi:hypothetical protein
MDHFRLKRTVTRHESVYDEALREFGRHDDVPPVHIDTERFDRALAGLAAERTIVPNGMSVDEICNFMNQIAAAK